MLAIPALVISATAQIHPTPFKNGCVVSDSAIASQVGAQIMKQGGNAVDAAVATGLALAVTFPAAGNLGGGGFMVVRMADGFSAAIDYREVAPRSASRDMFLDATGKVTNDSLEGYRASGVPGTPMGMWRAHRMFGKLPWKAVVEPSIKLAREGFIVDRGLADDLKQAARLFKKFPASYSQFCRNGKFYQWGETFKQPELARTLKLIQEQGAVGFYHGETATKIAKAMRAQKGEITEADLQAYQAIVRMPVRGKYKDFQFLTMPPPSSGGVCLLQMLQTLEPFDLKGKGFQSAGTMHLITEAMKLSFADRSQYFGDPGFVSVPIEQLLSPNYIAQRRKMIKPNIATPSNEIRPGLDPMKEGEHTTHYSVVDKWGNAVSNTYTLNTGFGSGVTVAGFLLNNEMDDFAAKVGEPNVYGLVQGEANAIAPGKRPLSSMTPTIVLKNGKLHSVLGSPGGPTIINTVLQTFLNVSEFGMSIQEAVAAPRFHHQWLPDQIRYEPNGLNAELKSALEKMGHKFAARPGRMGSCHAIQIGPDSVRFAGTDPRVSSSGAAGY